MAAGAASVPIKQKKQPASLTLELLVLLGGATGFEPVNLGSTIRCLKPLGDAPPNMVSG